MTQKELAWCAGISVKVLSAMERGRRSIDMDLAQRLAEVLGAHPKVLLHRSKPINEKEARRQARLVSENLTQYEAELMAALEQ